MKLEITPFVKLGVETIESPEIQFQSENDPTLNIRFLDGRVLEVWPSGHYQFWSPEELLVEGDDLTDTLFAYGSTTVPTHALH